MKYYIFLALLLLGCAGQVSPGGNSSSAQESNPMPALLSAADFAEHADNASCWVVYESKVYDITGYLSSHPNYREVLLPHCGNANGSFAGAFEGSHGTEKVEALVQEGTYMGTLLQ